MKTKGFKYLALILSATLIFSVGCKKNKSNTIQPPKESSPVTDSTQNSEPSIESYPNHNHVYNKQVTDEAHLKASATCKHGDQYYYSCECGKNGEEYFDNNLTIPCDYSAEIEDEKYLRRKATCQRGAEYYKSCTMCGDKAYRNTFISKVLGGHSYTEENPSSLFIKEEATSETPAVFYKSCICRAIGTESFTYGEPLRTYTSQEKLDCTPISLTVSLYDTENQTYGFTYNTSAIPLRAVIQVSEDVDFTNFVEYPTHFVKESTILSEGGSYAEYYIVKAEVALDANKTYYYRAYDKYVEVGSKIAKLKTKDLTSQSFTFAHLSDTQSSSNVGSYFGDVLAHVTTSSDFIVHTGDVVESSLYESEWKNMLHENFNYLSTIPIMAISGNHETTYKNGNNETHKHFNNKIPSQNTNLGYYYSFVYGNAKFIMLNTNRLNGNKLTDDQYEWLIEELSNNTAKWTIVAMHNPMYSAGTYGSNPERNQICLALREQLHNIFVEYGVDIVLQGHDHLFSKTHSLGKDGNPLETTKTTVDGKEYAVSNGGVIYVMSGTAGEQERTVYAPNSYLFEMAENSKKRSWAEFTIDGDKLTVSVKYTNGGRLIELYSWNLLKDGSAS